MTAYGYHAALPGQSDVFQTTERNVLWLPAPGTVHYWSGVVISSTAVDSGNTPTTLLRPGLVIARLDTGEYVAYDPDATDGSQEAVGILTEEVYLLDPATGAAADRFTRLLVRGGVVASECINLDDQARAQLSAKGFFFDDGTAPTASFARVVEKAANYTVVADDSGTRFVATTGAVTFTLPAIAAGLYFEFLNSVNAAMTISSAEGENVLTTNNASADGVAFSTASLMIGALCRVEAMYVGGALKWVPINQTPGNTMTIVDA